MKSKNAPQRTCIGCRAKKPKEELVRITLDSKGNIVLDKNKQLGRGAYLCKLTNQLINKSTNQLINKDCLEQAMKKNAFKYAFKKKKTTVTLSGVKIPACRTTAHCNCNGSC